MSKLADFVAQTSSVVKVDPTTGQTVIVGPGGEVKTLNLDPDTSTIVYWGDSFVAQMFGAAGTSYEAIGYGTWQQALLGQRLELLKVAGYSGFTTVQLLATFDAAFAGLNPGYVDIHVGINGLGVAGALDVEKAALTECINKVRNLGATVILHTLPVPILGHAYYTTNPALLKDILEFNAHVRRLASTGNKILLVDDFSVIVDPASVTAQPLPGMIQAAPDRIHLQPKGAHAIGKLGYSVLNPIIPFVERRVSTEADNWLADNSNRNILDKGLYASGTTGAITGTATGTAATGHTINGNASSTVVASIVDAPSGVGKAQQAIFGAGAANDRVLISRSVPSARVSGRFLQAMADIQVSGDDLSKTNLYRLTMDVSVNGSTSTVFGLGGGIGMTWPSEPVTLTLMTPPLLIPDGAVLAGNVNCGATYQANSAVSGVNFKVSRAKILN